MYKFLQRMGTPPCAYRKLWLAMKLTTLLLIIGIMQVSATSLAQKVVLSEKNAPLAEVFDKISQQTGYDFIFTKSILNQAKPVTLQFSGDISDALKKIFETEPLEYQVTDKSVLVKIKEKAESNAPEKVKTVIAGIDVHGRVVDETGQPLNQATVKTKDGKQVTTTDVKGQFTLHNVEPNSAIIISFIGYDNKEIAATADIGIIKLKPTTNPLDEVKVIAYGNTTERLNVGNVSSINAKTIEQQPQSNPILDLQGQVPGIVITPSSSIPGAAIDVKIHGQNSLASGYDPLYVIDGIPYFSQMPAGSSLGQSVYGLGGFNGLNTYGAGNPMAFINAEDIEGISVLKDADATAVYGSRAANGAILITTKKGRVGETNVNFNLQSGFSKIPHLIPMMNTQEYLQMREAALRNDGLAAPTRNNKYDINGTWDTTRYTNWQQVLLGGSAQYQDYNATVSGGTANVQFLVGGTYRDQGVIWGDNFSDRSGGLHFNFTNISPNQKFRVTLTGSYNTDVSTIPSIDPGAYIYMSPDAPALYNSDGTINFGLNSSGVATFDTYNPAIFWAQTYHNQVTNLIGNLSTSYQINKELDIKINSGYTKLQQNEYQLFPLTTIAPSGRVFGNNSAKYEYANGSSWLLNPQIHFQKLTGRNSIDLLLGGNLEQQDAGAQSYNGVKYASDTQLKDPSAATTLTSNSTSVATYRYEDIFARLNYNFDNRYILELSGNRDGSSRFGANNQFHNFWSVAGGWLFSNESLIKNSVPLLSTGKLHVSYGLTGNDQIGNYQYLSLYNPVSSYGIPYQNVTSYVPQNLPNPNLQWEDDRKLDLGLDIGFFKDRFFFKTDFYSNRSSNQLISYLLPIQSGYNSIAENFPAKIRNSGFEFMANVVNIKTDYFSWSTNINLTIQTNKLLSFPGISQSSYSTSLIVGQYFTGRVPVYRYAGVNSQTGEYQFYTRNGTLTYSPNPQTDLLDTINTNPRFYGGLGNTIRYHSFSLNFLFRFVKQTGLNNFFGVEEPGLYNFKRDNQPLWLRNGVWQTPGNISQYQRYNQSASIDGQFLYASQSNAAYGNDSYIRLQNIAFSWEMPQKWIKSISLKSVNLFINGENLFTVTGYKGLDPQSPGLSSYSTLRTISFGIHASL